MKCLLTKYGKQYFNGAALLKSSKTARKISIKRKISHIL